MSSLAKWVSDSLYPSRCWDDVFCEIFPSELFTSKLNPKRNAKVNVYETDSQWTVDAELPGFSKEDIKLDINDGVLKIEVAQKKEKEDSKMNYVIKEISQENYARCLRIPSYIDQSSPDAVLKDGVLSVSFPKSKTSQTKIEIK